jgi:hypothetical protein
MELHDLALHHRRTRAHAHTTARTTAHTARE